MRTKFSTHFLLLIFISLTLTTFTTKAQDERSQLPGILKHAYFGVNVGLINYNFGANQFQAPSGYNFQKVELNPAAVRLILYGYEFNKYLSAQISYMRPVNWVSYYYDAPDINNPLQKEAHRSSVWMNVGGLTLRPELPLGAKFSLHGEAGLAIVTRHGFTAIDNETDIIKGVTYPSVLLGGGVNYHVNDAWRIVLSGTYTPESKKHDQPAISFLSAGFNYKLQPISQKLLDKAAERGYIHPKQWLQIGYTNNAAGYGINNGLEKACLFWGGDVEVRQGLTLNYQRNIYHSSKYFALDWGVSASGWQTKGVGTAHNNPEKETFFTLSVYPALRFNIVHAKPFDAYVYYSVAGPTYISKTDFKRLTPQGKEEIANTGEHFTFQDVIGMGAFFGEKRKLNAEFRIGHYSNGNIFPVNAAVKIPLSFNIGYVL